MSLCSVSPPINVLLFSRRTVFCHPVSLSLISKYASVYYAEFRLCLRHQDLVLLSHPCCLFLLPVPACRVCLSALALMDLSVVGLQHILQLRMSRAMICISLERWNETVRLVEQIFHHANRLWFYVSMLDSRCSPCKHTSMTKHHLISRIKLHLFYTYSSTEMFSFTFLLWEYIFQDYKHCVFSSSGP